MTHLSALRMPEYDLKSLQYEANSFRGRHLTDPNPIAGADLHVIGDWVFVPKGHNEIGYYVVSPDSIGETAIVTGNAAQITWNPAKVPYARICRILSAS